MTTIASKLEMTKVENIDLNGHSSHIIKNKRGLDVNITEMVTNEGTELEKRETLSIEMMMGLTECDTCGRNLTTILRQVESGKYILKNAPCQQTSFLVTVTEVDFPSGEILVGDHIEGITNYIDFEKLSISGEVYSSNHIYNSIGSTPVQKVYMEELAKYNIVHGMCGNSAPNIFGDPNNNLYLARIASDEWYFNEKSGKYDATLMSEAHDRGIADEVDCLTDEEKNQIKDWRNKGYIITDLWAYTLIDAEEYKKLCKVDNIPSDAAQDKIKVKPGRYRFTHYTDNNYYSFDDNVKIFGFGEYLGPL